jgi:hypothetical protein
MKYQNHKKVSKEFFNYKLIRNFQYSGKINNSINTDCYRMMNVILGTQYVKVVFYFTVNVT